MLHHNRCTRNYWSSCSEWKRFQDCLWINMILAVSETLQKWIWAVCDGWILIDLQISGGKNSPGSFSRSAVNYNAGCYTTMSNIVMSLTVMVVLLALTPLFKYTPSAILASVIMSAVVSLIDIRAAYLIWKVDKFDFLSLLGAFFGTLFVSIEIGLLIAVSKASTLPPNQCSLHHC